MSTLYEEVYRRHLAQRLAGAMGGHFASVVPIRDGVIVSASQVAVNGAIYDMDSSGLGLQPGEHIPVKNVSRLAAAKYVPADAFGGSGGSGGSTGGGMVSHDIIGTYHYVTGTHDLVVGLVADNRLGLLDVNKLVRLWKGREEGPRAGIWEIYSVGASDPTIIQMAAVDTGNDPFFSAWVSNYQTNSTGFHLGYEGLPGIYLEDPTSVPGEPEQHRRVVVDLGTLAQLITHNYLDLDELQGWLAFGHGTELPDARIYPPGLPYLLQSPGDPNLFVLFVRDHLDNWQMLGGAGYMAPHNHTSEETGGLLNTEGVVVYEPLCCNNEALFCGGDCLMIGVTI